MLDDAPVISAIVEKRKALSPERALLVGISGIDAFAPKSSRRAYRHRMKRGQSLLA
jgi:hypothetical protein